MNVRIPPKGGVICLVLLVLATAPAQGQQPDHILVDMTAEDHVTLTTVTVLTGADAHTTRASIDAKYGNADGNVSASEVDSYRTWFSSEFSRKYTQNTFLDGKNLFITITDIKLDNATTSVGDGLPLTRTIVSEMEGQGVELGAQWHNIVISASYYANDTVTIRVPLGWRISQAMSNFEELSRSGDGRTVTGRMVDANSNARIKTYDPQKVSLPGSGEDSPLQAYLLIFTAVVILVIILAVALERRRRAGAGEGKGVSTEKSDRPWMRKGVQAPPEPLTEEALKESLTRIYEGLALGVLDEQEAEELKRQLGGAV